MRIRHDRGRAAWRLAPLLVLFLTSAVTAQDVLQPGDWRLEGRNHKGRVLLVLLNVEQVDGELRVERTGSLVEVEDSLERPDVWTSTSVEVAEDHVWVTYARRKRGLAGNLAGLDDDEDPVEVLYYLTDDEKRLYEWIDGDDSDDGKWSWAKGGRDLPTLELVREARFEDLLGDDLKAYEASGVVVADGGFHVVFDNSTKIAVVDTELSSAELEKTGGSGQSNFEGLTRDPVTGHFFAIVEYARHQGRWAARVWELDAELDRLGDTRMRRFYLPGNNKGFEGVAHVRRGGEEFLLALAEGNHGRADKSSRERGNGLIEVFRRKNSGKWSHHATINIPTVAQFSDYSGLDIRGDRLAVVSQTTSQVWIGELSDDDWEVDGEGKVYRFPRAKSRVLYSTVEGISWIDDDTLVAVSDKASGKNDTAESIHVFRLPE